MSGSQHSKPLVGTSISATTDIDQPEHVIVFYQNDRGYLQHSFPNGDPQIPTPPIADYQMVPNTPLVAVATPGENIAYTAVYAIDQNSVITQQRPRIQEFTPVAVGSKLAASTDGKINFFIFQNGQNQLVEHNTGQSGDRVLTTNHLDGTNLAYIETALRGRAASVVSRYLVYHGKDSRLWFIWTDNPAGIDPIIIPRVKSIYPNSALGIVVVLEAIGIYYFDAENRLTRVLKPQYYFSKPTLVDLGDKPKPLRGSALTVTSDNYEDDNRVLIVYQAEDGNLVYHRDRVTLPP